MILKNKSVVVVLLLSLFSVSNLFAQSSLFSLGARMGYSKIVQAKSSFPRPTDGMVFGPSIRLNAPGSITKFEVIGDCNIFVSSDSFAIKGDLTLGLGIDLPFCRLGCGFGPSYSYIANTDNVNYPVGSYLGGIKVDNFKDALLKSPWNLRLYCGIVLPGNVEMGVGCLIPTNFTIRRAYCVWNLLYPDSFSNATYYANVMYRF